jgi:putative addiction module CopG family antidote
MSSSTPLPTDLEEFVNRKVASGEYSHPGDVIAAAVAMLRDEDELSGADLTNLRREINVGLEQSRQGQSRPLDMHAIREQVRARRASRRTA